MLTSKKKTTALVCFLLSFFMCFLLSGCTNGRNDKDSRPAVKIAICQQKMIDSFSYILRSTFPNVRFEFTLANNSLDYYKYLASHNDLPDIITVRRFSMKDAYDLKGCLLDLSHTDTASSFYQNYLQNFTYGDGVINFLPSLGEVWCIVANKSLFEEYGIALPTDYASFVSACKAFEKQGITGFTSDWSYDYTELEILQGFNIDTLQTREGRIWRFIYDQENRASEDGSVWLESFENLEKVLNDTENIGHTKEEGTALLANSYDSIKKDFAGKKIAMIRSSGGDLDQLKKEYGFDLVLLPYFGKNENWILTYPCYQAAVSANSKVDRELLLEIYEFMMSSNLQIYMNDGTNLISYTSELDPSYNFYLENLSEYIDRNKVYIRSAGTDFFKASEKAVKGMIADGYSAQKAYEVFYETLKSQDEKKPAATVSFKTFYPYDFENGFGSKSSSSILNTLRKIWGSDIMLSYPICFSNSVYTGELPLSDMPYLFAGNYGRSYEFSLSGKQIKDLLSVMTSYSTDGEVKKSGFIPVENYMLPVVSGLIYSVNKREDGGYSLASVNIKTSDGKTAELDEDKVYTVTYAASSEFAGYIAKKAGLNIHEIKEMPLQSKALKAYLGQSGNELEAPSAYVLVK